MAEHGSAGEQQQNAVTRPEKHAAEDVLSSSAKRAHTDAGVEAVSAFVTEKDVGIIAYIQPKLVPIEGGIIKQRFSDFHVREVARGGQVCHITSLDPPTADEGGAGLYEQLAATKAEHDDKTGELRARRVAKETAERKARDVEQQAERQKAAERTWEWSFDDEQLEKLRKLLGEQGVTSLKTLWTQGPPRKGAKIDGRPVSSQPISSKEDRTAAHLLIRELFESNLTTDTIEVHTAEEKSSALRIRWNSGKQDHRQQRTGQQQQTQIDAPPYIHFLLQKTNRDSQDALNILSRSLGLQRGSGGGGKPVKELSVAGTKDKRGVTVQQVALRRGRKTLDDVWRMANCIGRPSPHDRRAAPRTNLDAVQTRGERGIRVAHLRYAEEPLFLGSAQGNEFEIVLRNVKVRSRADVDAAVQVLRTTGFVNYFGMQRFGTSAISTHRVGLALLRDDFAEAVELIMAPREGDPPNVQEAREAYQNGDLDKSYNLFPNFNVPERSIIGRMRSDRMTHFPSGQRPAAVDGADWKKYFNALPRMMRTMYMHAYQSYAWNRITTERVQRYGVDKPVVGDFVLLSGDLEHDVDADGDDDEAALSTHQHGRKHVKVLASEEDVAQYTIHDVVVPVPGSTVSFTKDSWADTAYRSILAVDGLTPDSIARAGAKSPELALTGDFRALLHRPRNVEYQLIRYTDPDVNLVQSDEDKILGLDVPPIEVMADDTASEVDGSPSFVALVLRLTLGVSAYATMALREVLKQDTSMAHQRELTRRGEDRIAPK